MSAESGYPAAVENDCQDSWDAVTTGKVTLLIWRLEALELLLDAWVE